MLAQDERHSKRRGQPDSLGVNGFALDFVTVAESMGFPPSVNPLSGPSTAMSSTPARHRWSVAACGVLLVAYTLAYTVLRNRAVQRSERFHAEGIRFTDGFMDGTGGDWPEFALRGVFAPAVLLDRALFGLSPYSKGPLREFGR